MNRKFLMNSTEKLSRFRGISTLRRHNQSIGRQIALGFLSLLTLGGLTAFAQSTPTCGAGYTEYHVGWVNGPNSSWYCASPHDANPTCDGGDGDGDCGSCQGKQNLPGIVKGDGMGGSGYSQGDGMGGSGLWSGNGDGMPFWSVVEPYLNLLIKDRPYFHRTSRGTKLGLTLNYKTFAGDNGRIDITEPAIFGVGTNWHTPWRSYVQPADAYSYFLFSGDGSARQLAYGGATHTNIDYYMRGGLFLDDSLRLCLGMPSGQLFVYNDFVVLGGVTNIFLSKILDPQGNATFFTYTVTNNNVRLSKITDMDSNQVTFTYTNTAYYSNLIATVTGPYGTSATLMYSSGGQLTNITDLMGLMSSLQYDSSNRVSKLITPYGTNAFDYYFSTTATNWSSLRITELGLRQTLYVEGATNQNILPSAISESSSLSTFVGASTFEYDNFSERNTILWAPRQYPNLPLNVRSNLDNGTFDPMLLSTNDFQKGRLRHWLRNRGTYLCGLTLSLERGPSPKSDGSTEGLLTWFDYQDKSPNGGSSEEGKMMLPKRIGKRDPGGVWRVTYNEMNTLGNLTVQKQTYTDPSGTVQWRETDYTYGNGNGVDVTQITFGSEVVNNTFDSNHQLLTTEDALGQTTTYVYNGTLLTNRTTPSGLITDYHYDANNCLSSVVDYNGSGAYLRTNYFTYSNGLLYIQTDPRGLSTTNTWDALGRLIKMSDSDGYITNVYSNLDLVRVVDRMGLTNRYERDNFGRIVRMVDANNHTNTYQYCNCGSLDSVTDALGNTTSYGRDNLGRAITTTYPGGSIVTNTFNLLSEVVIVSDTAGVSATNFYTANGLLCTISNAAGRALFRGFDDHDRPRFESNQNGSKAGFGYDAVGRLIGRTNYLASTQWPPSIYGSDVYSCEVFNYTNGVTDPSGHEEFRSADFGFTPAPYTIYGYDELGRKTTEVKFDHKDGTPLLTNTFSYSPAGDLLTLTDGNFHTTTWNYDPHRRVANKIDAAGNTNFIYAYDANGRLTNRWTPAKGNALYKHDAVGNPTNIVYAVSPSISLAYDANNRLINMVDAVGTTVYGYTAFGALQSENGPWSSDTVTYSYDNGRRRSGLNLQAPNAADWVHSYTYDAAARLSSITSPAGTFNYRYIPGLDSSFPSPAGLVQKLSLPNGAYITNAFDDYGRMTNTCLRNSGDTILNAHSYTYNELNQRTTQGRTDGSGVTYGYDFLSQLTSALATEPGGTTNRAHERFWYGYDAAGNLTNRIGNLFTNNFTVNNLNELNNATRLGNLTVAGTTIVGATNVTVADNGNSAVAAIRYSDATFARTNVTLVSGTNTFTAIAKDSYGRTDTNTVSPYLPSTLIYTYDLNGNLVSDGRRYFDYDDENQLIRVVVTNSTRSDFAYDGRLRRRGRVESIWNGSAWVTNQIVQYAYDGNLVIEERDGNNIPTVAYTRAGDLIGGFESAGGIGGLLAFSKLSSLATQHSFYHADGNGNITMLINAAQIAVAKYLYDPFGNTLSSSGQIADANLYRFSSKETHIQADIAHCVYRYYESHLQRWMSKDPVDDLGFELTTGQSVADRTAGLNVYAFVRNDPLDFVDGLGLSFGNPIPPCAPYPDCLKPLPPSLPPAQPTPILPPTVFDDPNWRDHVYIAICPARWPGGKWPRKVPCDPARANATARAAAKAAGLSDSQWQRFHRYLTKNQDLCRTFHDLVELAKSFKYGD